MWATLEPHVRDAATHLGWEAGMWDARVRPSPTLHPWNQLLPSEQTAAEDLGYSQLTWDAEVDSGVMAASTATPRVALSSSAVPSAPPLQVSAPAVNGEASEPAEGFEAPIMRVVQSGDGSRIAGLVAGASKDVYVPGDLLESSRPGVCRVGDIVRGMRRAAVEDIMGAHCIWRAESVESISSPFILPVGRSMPPLNGHHFSFSGAGPPPGHPIPGPGPHPYPLSRMMGPPNGKANGPPPPHLNGGAHGPSRPLNSAKPFACGCGPPSGGPLHGCSLGAPSHEPMRAGPAHSEHAAAVAAAKAAALGEPFRGGVSHLFPFGVLIEEDTMMHRELIGEQVFVRLRIGDVVLGRRVPNETRAPERPHRWNATQLDAIGEVCAPDATKPAPARARAPHACGRRSPACGHHQPHPHPHLTCRRWIGSRLLAARYGRAARAGLAARWRRSRGHGRAWRLQRRTRRRWRGRRRAADGWTAGSLHGQWRSSRGRAARQKVSLLRHPCWLPSRRQVHV